jgi:hypothetical protein
MKTAHLFGIGFKAQTLGYVDNLRISPLQKMVGLENRFKKSKDFLLAYIVNEYWQKLTAAKKMKKL